MGVRAIPEGFHTVSPYLVVDGAAKLIEFVVHGLGGQLVFSHPRLDGKIMHAVVKLGDSMVLLADASAERSAMPCSLYLYVEDVDALYDRALAAGATSIMAPQDKFYGDRNAGVKDACGIQWWFGTHVEDLTAAELTRRQHAQPVPQKKP